MKQGGRQGAPAKQWGKEAIILTNTITYCAEKPIKTDIADWMNDHIGRVSVGRDMDDYYEIIAYSDQKSDRPELQKMAREEKAIYIKSVLSEGVTAID